MLETVIKFHRLKYVRGKNKKTWLAMVLESIGSVGGEEGSGLGTSQSSFWQGWVEMGKGVHSMQPLATLSSCGALGAKGINSQEWQSKKKKTTKTKVDSMTTW